jgi:chaperonin GroEL (HSP60 family)
MSYKIKFNNDIGKEKICEFDENVKIVVGYAAFSCTFDTEITDDEFAAVFDKDKDVWDSDNAMEAMEELEKNSEICTLIVKVGEDQIVSYVEKSASDLLQAFNESKQDGDMYFDISACSGYEPLKQKVSGLINSMS